MATNDGGPAFPTYDAGPEDKTVTLIQGGMSLLDWFAGQALGSLLTSNGPVTRTFSNLVGQNKTADAILAEAAYLIAEAMLAEKERRATRMT